MDHSEILFTIFIWDYFTFYYPLSKVHVMALIFVRKMNFVCPDKGYGFNFKCFSIVVFKIPFLNIQIFFFSFGVLGNLPFPDR